MNIVKTIHSLRLHLEILSERVDISTWAIGQVLLLATAHALRA